MKIDENDPRMLYDQYAQFENLPCLLKRYSFNEKMRMSCINSAYWILNKLSPEANGILPWVLETFVMISMEAYEYSDGDFRGKNDSKFVKMVNAIWNSHDSIQKLHRSKEFSFTDMFFPATMLKQSLSQESISIKTYRYWTLFNNKSVPLNAKEIQESGDDPVYLRDKFIEKMGASYEDFLMLGHTIELLFGVQEQKSISVIPQKALNYLLLEKYPQAAKNLIISRKDYVRKQQAYTMGQDRPAAYVYSLSPSYQYPFVKEGTSLYFPLPHLLTQSVTSSLYYRLTEGDNSLRKILGKTILETYLYDLIHDSEIYDEVYPEQKYKEEHAEAYSPDVLACKDGAVLFLDSKSTVPSLGIRLWDEDAIKNNIKVTADNIKKIYKQIERFKLYNPFKTEVSEQKKDYWGVIVILEESFIFRHFFYEEAAKLLNIETTSKEYRWLTHHIKVASLYEVERLSLTGCSIIEGCQDINKDNPNDRPFSNFGSEDGKIKNTKYKEFEKNYKEAVINLAKNMIDRGCFS